MSDTLVIVAQVPGAYPTQNTMWATSARRGKKTGAYHDLFDAVVTAAEAEIARTGWVSAECLCAVSLTLYHRTARVIDASNAGKAELDALTAAGVWADDKLANPVTLATEHDPTGESRVVIIIRRRFPPLVAAPSAIVIAARKLRANPPALERAVVAEAPRRWAEVNGKRVPYEYAMREIRAGRLR